MTKRNVRRKISPLTFCSLTFLILSHLTVCLLVSRVRAYLSTNQQHGIPCLIKRGPLPDWPVWTRGLMLSGNAAEREDITVESTRREGQSPPSKPHGKQSPPLKPHGEQSPPLQPQGEQSPPSKPLGTETSPMPNFTGHGPGSVRLLPRRVEKKQPLEVVTMSLNKETTFMAQTTTLGEERSSSMSPMDLPPGLSVARNLEGRESLLFPESHPTNPQIDAVRKRIAKGNSPMVSRRIEEDGVLLGHTKWVKEGQCFVEKLVPITEAEEGRPLVIRRGSNNREPKSPEEDLSEEITKLLERKDGPERRESLSGDSEEGSFDLDYFADEMGDITVYQANVPLQESESSNTPARERPVVGDPFEEQQFEQPNVNGNEVTTHEEQPVLTKQKIMELVASNVGGILPGSGWNERKQGYCDLFKGYESPTGNTVRASMELAALMVIAAVSENAKGDEGQHL